MLEGGKEDLRREGMAEPKCYEVGKGKNREEGSGRERGGVVGWKG